MALIVVATHSGLAATLTTGAKLDVLDTGKISYRHVVVRSISARTVTISHDGGMASIALRSLSPELQRAFGYSPEAEIAADAADAAKAEAQAARLTEAAAKKKQEVAAKTTSPINADTNVTSRITELRTKFGQKPEVRTEGVDFRKQFAEFSLTIKDQGVRPSCAIFAAVSALEFQNAQLTGKTETFSEEYLIWATCKLLGRPIQTKEAAVSQNPEDAQRLEMGFSLGDVMMAIRKYGVPLRDDLPYKYNRNAAVVEPPVEVVEAAKSHNRVAVAILPGDNTSTRLSNLVQALNHGMPVPIGLTWPYDQPIRAGLINTQPASPRGHAVTVVGYRNQTGDIRDTTFIVKNSWGTNWGIGGYGFITYNYLFVNLKDAVVLDVLPLKSR